MPRVALKIAYDGTSFHGQARQPGLPTVEGETIHALVKARAIRDVHTARFQSASRTDRGVSALGNVVAFDTPFEPAAAVRAFNAKSEGVWAWAAAPVPSEFSARRARERWYRYLLPIDHDLASLGAALFLFQGTHDFRNFTRDRGRAILRIDLAGASRDRSWIALDFKARSFRWNLVRRLASAALRVEAGRATIADLDRALTQTARADFGLAPPEPLTLMDVAYEFPFESVADPTTADRLRGTLAGHLLKARFLEALQARFFDPHQSPPREHAQEIDRSPP